MGVADTLRVIERASVTSGVVTNDEFRTLLDTYTAMQRTRDPLAAIGAHLRYPTGRHSGRSPPTPPVRSHPPNPPTTHRNAQARRFTLLPAWLPWLDRMSTTKACWWRAVERCPKNGCFRPWAGGHRPWGGGGEKKTPIFFLPPPPRETKFARGGGPPPPENNTLPWGGGSTPP